MQVPICTTAHQSKHCRHKLNDVLSCCWENTSPRQPTADEAQTHYHGMAVMLHQHSFRQPAEQHQLFFFLRLMSGSSIVCSKNYDTECRRLILWPHLHASSDPLFIEHMMTFSSPVPATSCSSRSSIKNPNGTCLHNAQAMLSAFQPPTQPSNAIPDAP
jgi:hypothetical protein